MRGSEKSILSSAWRVLLSLALSVLKAAAPTNTPYLERQASLDLLLEDVCDSAIKVGEDLHGQLGVDAVVCNQIIEGIRERSAEADVVIQVSQSVAFHDSSI